MKQLQYVEETSIDRALREGRDEGRNEGLKEGMLALRRTLRSILSTRFSDLPVAISEQVESLEDIQVLEMLIKQAIVVNSLQDITFFQKNI